MKRQNRHISNVKKLIIGMVAAIAILACLLYFYHTNWKGVYIVDNVPTSLVGVGIIIIIPLVTCTVVLLGGILLNTCFPKQKTKNNNE